MANPPRLGSESFWEMSALAMEGWLASCQSCVEHFYFQSWQNSSAFLDACAAGGLVEKVSLLDLCGDLGPRPFPTLRQQWYDQAIYISAPIFRKENLDAARRKIEGTKRAVYEAFRLYYEVLRADHQRIDAAYMNAVQKGEILRHPEIAYMRLDVDLSSVAKLRLIQDGYKNKLKGEKLPAGELEKRVTEATTEYVLKCSGHKVPSIAVHDRAEELKKFVLDFLANESKLPEFSQPGGKLPLNYRLRLLPVIRELAYYLFSTFRKRGESDAQTFAADVREKICKAKERAANDETYTVALSELMEDFDYFVTHRQDSVFVPTPDANHLGPEATA